MSISFTPLGSGSKGNSILVGTEEGKFLIDCGFCIKNLKERLLATGTELEEILGVVITHEHSDHIKSATMLADKYGIPIIGHEKTLRYIRNKSAEAQCAEPGAILRTALSFSEMSPFKLAGVTVIPFRTPHDAVYPVGYRFEDGESVAVYATDIGYVSSEVKSVMKGASLVMIESNYDRDMLIHGKYPPLLKERIMSKYGHLSNDDCAFTVANLLKDGTQNFILGHISEENNTPECVAARTLGELEMQGAVNGKDFNLTIALQGIVGEKRDALGKKIPIE